MHKALIFLLLLSITSCDYFHVKKTSSEVILQEELEAFKWNEVDVYPNFASCGSDEDNAGKKECFENTLIASIYDAFASENIIVTQDIQDTILVRFEISELGKLSLLEAKIDSVTTLEIPNMENILHKSLEGLPEIYPAIKRGQQVKTQFTLPIRIQVD